MKPLSEVVPLLLVIQIQTQAVWKVGRSDATPIIFFLFMETFWENFGNIFSGVASLLPSFPTSRNGHF